MKTPIAIVALIAVLSPAILQAQQPVSTPAAARVSPSPSATPAGKPTPASQPPLAGVKPARGVPKFLGNLGSTKSGPSNDSRFGGLGTRGCEGAGASLFALVPDAAGLTTKAAPCLFWYQSKPVKAELIVTVTEPGKSKPVIRLSRKIADKAGIQRVKLAKYPVSLTPNVLYHWSVALVTDPENRSTDTVATGAIRRATPPDALTAQLTKASSAEQPFIYANAGIWYDAIESVSDLIDANPNEKAFHTQRAALLAQVGLKEAAAADRK